MQPCWTLPSLIMESPRISCTNGWGFVPNTEDTTPSWMLPLACSELAECLDTASFSNLRRENEVSFQDLDCLALADGERSTPTCDRPVSRGRSLLSRMSNPFAGRLGEATDEEGQKPARSGCTGVERSSFPKLESYSHAGEPPARSAGGSIYPGDTYCS